MPFPQDFIWGVASAAYQIEGAVAEDGRSPSIWDVLSHEPGRIYDSHNGDVACDHYHRWREDIALLRELGVGAYRLSVAWPRIIPDGSGAVNERGLAFYDQLIDALLEAGITPWVTLYHWDLPQVLQLRGGWLNRDIVEWFGRYAEVVAGRLGDRVKNWITINEPPCVIGVGYQEGLFAPALKLTFRECLLGAHHLLLAHGRAVQALRAGCRGPVKVSIAYTARDRIPDTESPSDIDAARRDTFACRTPNFWNLSWWADPVLLGHYPAEGLEAFVADLPAFTDGDMRLISQPVDFFGYNCYTGFRIRAGSNGEPERVPGGWGIGHPHGTLPWLAVTPDGPYWSSRFLHERYKQPIVFAENGFCSHDWVHLDGKVHDPQRIDYLARYLSRIRRATDEGIPVAGYFAWALLDNFEWMDGYKERFGLVHVDFATQKRTPKDSFDWYRDTIRTNGAHLP